MQEQPTGHHDTDICGSLWRDIQWCNRLTFIVWLVSWQVAPVVMATAGGSIGLEVIRTAVGFHSQRIFGTTNERLSDGPRQDRWAGVDSIAISQALTVSSASSQSMTKSIHRHSFATFVLFERKHISPRPNVNSQFSLSPYVILTDIP